MRGSRARRRSCPPPPATCPAGSPSPARTEAPCHRGSADSSGRRRTRSRPRARAGRGRRDPRGASRGRGGAPSASTSISSVIPLKVFPSITNAPPAGSRAPRWRFESFPCRRPCPHSAARTTRSSVCAGFTFNQPAPRLPASYGASSAFTITPSWPRASASSRNACATAVIVGLYPRNDQLLRETRRERDEPLAGRSVDEVGAVDVEAVEEEGAERRPGRRRLRAEAAHRDLERLGTPVRTERYRLAVEDDRIHVELPHGGCDLGYAIGDVREVACEEAHLAPRPVRLDAGAVELPLDARTAEPAQRARDVVGGLRQHRRDGVQRREPEPREAGCALPHCHCRDGSQIAREHRRPPHVAGRKPGRPGNRVGHHAFERALTKLAEEQSYEQPLLRLGRGREELRQAPHAAQPASPCRRFLGAGSRRHRHRGARARVPSRAAAAPSAPPTPPRPCPAAVRLRGRRPRSRPRRQSRGEALGEPRDLRQPRRRGCDVSGRLSDPGQEHPRHSTSSAARSTRRRHPRRGSRHVRCRRGHGQSRRRSRDRSPVPPRSRAPSARAKRSKAIDGCGAALAAAGPAHVLVRAGHGTRNRDRCEHGDRRSAHAPVLRKADETAMRARRPARARPARHDRDATHPRPPRSLAPARASSPRR